MQIINGEGRMPQEIEAVVFDLDGTLIDTYGSHRQKLKKVFRSFEISWRARHTHLTHAHWGKKMGTAFFQEAFRDEVPEEDLDHTALAANILYQRLELRRKPRLIPGVLETFAALETIGVHRLLLTNRDGNTTRVYLRALGLIDRFLHLGYGDRHQKPEPLIAADTLEKLAEHGIPPERTIIVGDSHDDRLLGKALGIRTVLVATSTLTHTNIEDHPRENFIPSVAHLPSWFRPEVMQAA